jgi:tryptophan synthase beta chain
MLHQTIIGEEARMQMEMVGDFPDIVIGCAGGGSNFAGLTFPFMRDKLNGSKNNLEIIAVEPSSCPTLTTGKFEYDFGDEAGMTPLLKMYTLGHKFIPPKIHSGGLRYHGMAPTISHLYNLGKISAVAYDQLDVFDAAKIFAQTEGIVPHLKVLTQLRRQYHKHLNAKKVANLKQYFLICQATDFSISALMKYILIKKWISFN